MYQLTDKEVTVLLSQNVIPSRKSLGGHNPYAFTEQRVAMLSEITLVDQPEKTELEYRVIAVNKAGDGSPSNTVMVVL